MEKRTLLAIILTLGVWVGWFWLYPPKPAPENQDSKKVVSQDESKKIKDVKNEQAGSEKKFSGKYTKISGKIKSEEISVDTKKFRFVLSNKGAVIRDAKYIERDDAELIFDSKLYNSNGYFDFAVHFSGDEFFKGNDLQDLNWAVAKDDPKTVRFYTDVNVKGNDLRIEKVYKFTENGYDFRVEYRFINRGKGEISLANDEIIVSPGQTLGPKLDYTNTYNILKGVYSIDGSHKLASKGGSFFGDNGELIVEPGNIDYAGIMSRYFLLLMKPDGFSGTKAYFDNRKTSAFRTGLSVKVGKLAKGSVTVKSFKVYLGEKNKDFLGAVDPILKDASDVSTLIEPIRYFVMWALLKIYGLFGNLGWALVVFSILTKIVFMPLTKKSTESMKKLQEIGPELKKLQAKYKDKPDVLQRETMKMYKENNVNPMGGCLPMILQMPFFFGLYSALINSIHLWNAPFMLWMKDLSMPDHVATIAGHSIHVLPVLMAISMFVQQKQTMSDVGSQQQKIMMYMMPFLMLLIFWNMPSGLVLYWFLQNLYQILNQYVVNHMDNRKQKAAA